MQVIFNFSMYLAIALKVYICCPNQETLCGG